MNPLDVVTETATYHHDHEGAVWRTEYVVVTGPRTGWKPASGPYGRRADAEAAAAALRAQEPSARVVRYETEPGAFTLPPMH